MRESAATTTIDPPLLFFTRSQGESFDPFVDIGRGFVGIKPDWVSHGGAVRPPS